METVLIEPDFTRIDNFLRRLYIFLWKIKMRGKPMSKSKAIIDLLEQQSQELYGRGYQESITKEICVSCGTEELKLKNEISRREYKISGFCQTCQDSVFGKDQV